MTTSAVEPAASWAEISVAAMELNMVCLGTLGSYSGGVTFCGEHEMIKITLRGFGRGGVDDAVNATATGTATA